MKKNRKILALALAVILSAVMLVTASGLEIFIIASSEDYESYATSAKYLEILDILKGYDDGELHLEEPILRYQAALLFARVVTGVVDDTAWGTGASTQYTDVPEYGPVMDFISGIDIIRGYGNGLFGYNDGIRYQDMCAMFVRALGYETEDMVKAYPMSYVTKVEKLGFALNNVLPADYLNRGQVAQMLYDVLQTEIAETNDEKLQLVIDLLSKNNPESDIDETKDTYLERNFDVSARMQFLIVATENYGMISSDSKADKNYFNAVNLSSGEFEMWTFPVEGEAVNGVTEADLIGKIVNVVFDDKTPTADEFEREDCGIVHAEMVNGETFENKGELSYVKFNTAGTSIFFGSKEIKLADLNAIIYQHSTDENYVYTEIAEADLKTTLENNTYFKLEAYDYDGDGEYDYIFYTPYLFGQYARRRYSNNVYTMVGRYSENFVYDVSTSSELTDDNKTHFIEHFLGGDDMATTRTSYRPGDTSIAVGDEGKYSLNANVIGESAVNGDFILYSYNIHSGEFCIVENLGTYQTGELSGFSTRSQTITIDGAEMTVGVPGKLNDANGLLTGDSAFASKQALAKKILADYTKGEANAKYIEYDTKLVYLESYGAAAASDAGDYAVIDIEASYDAAIEADEDALDVIYGDEYITVKQLDLATGELVDINVETVAVVGSTLKCDNIDTRYALGAWNEKKAYNTIKNAGAIYLIEDDDEDGLFELYAYGTDEFRTVSGAAIVTPADGEPSIYYSYNRSNNFIDPDDNGGFEVDRLSTGASTVSVVIGADGYILVKGVMGTNSSARPNELYLSAAARAIEATDKQLVIFDPVSNVTLDADNNVFKSDRASIWNTGEAKTETDSQYYMLLNSSEYIESGALLDADGNAVKTEDGDALYEHIYTGLYNLIDGSVSDVTVITTDPDPVFTEVASSLKGVLRVDADEYEASAVYFEEVFVENGIYRNATLDNFFAKDRLTVNIEGKDEDGNGVLTGDEKGLLIKLDSINDAIYDSLDGLSYTFIDLDGGVDVDPEEYCFDDAYVFYNSNASNLKNYATVNLEDRDLHATTIAIKRHMYIGKDIAGEIANGAVTPYLEAGVAGKVYGQTYFSRNGWSDYLIPAVDEDGNTIWKYEGSLRVKVVYNSFAYYNEDTNSLTMVIVRVGTVDEVVDAGDSLPDVSDMPVETE